MPFDFISCEASELQKAATLENPREDLSAI